MKQQYDSYKPSGIDWIGEIPSHWESKRLRFACEFRNGYTPSKDNKAFWMDGTIPWYRMEDIRETGRFLNKAKQYITEEAVKGGGLFEAGSFLLATTATIGEHAMLIVDSLANQQFTNLKIRKSLKNSLKGNFFFYYLFVIDEFCKSSTKISTFPAMNMEDLRNFGVCIPPLAEQEAIAAWLDEKCGEIDAAIAKVDREIELIDELKQSEISRVVTRGLNSDVPLRPSGIDWIGDIPEHWTYIPVKYFFYLKGRIGWQGLKADEFKEEGPHLVTGTDFENGRVNWNKCYRITEERFNEAPEIHVKEGDLLITKDGTVGKLAYIEDKPNKVSLNSHLLIIRPLKEFISNKYVFWYCHSNIFKDYSGLIQDGSIMASLSQEDFSNFRILLPPLSEQHEIADYLDKKCAEIDGLKAKLKKKREALVELRQSLISEVVTGKRRVV